MPQSFRSITTQVTEHLRTHLLQGRWQGALPGRDQLASELGVNRKTVEAALRQLEKEKLLINPGQGKRRRIKPGASRASNSLRVALLLSHRSEQGWEVITEILHRLRQAGHEAFYAEKTLGELGMKPSRVASLVSRTPADVWLVVAASREVLEWFIASSLPTLAIFGRILELNIPAVAPKKIPPLLDATRTLLKLGHRRIALINRPRRRRPQPGVPEQAYLDELKAHGIQPNAYHMPEWDETLTSFHAMLEALFRVTPPTALIVDEAEFFVAVMQFCLGRRLRVPEDISLICTDDHPVFTWCQPKVAHIAWDYAPVIRRVLQWVENIRQGRPDSRQTFTAARFVPGGTVAGPAR
jgi:DNA-binding LacI/PurR family transcriptional regulator